MSVPVETAALADALARYGDSAFLLTTSERGGPHAVAVRLSWDGKTLTTRAGKTSRSNMALRSDVTLLWPPVDEDEYSLIVDGAATVGGAGAGESADGVSVTPLRAVLHRNPARTAQDEPGSECVTVLRPGGGAAAR